MSTLLPSDPLPLGDRNSYSLLVQFPVVCFAGALATDLAYWQTALVQWETFSVWLLAVGCVFAGLTGIVGLIHFVGDRRSRAWKFAWLHAGVSVIAAVLSVVNAFVHSRDGYTAVVPEGLALSSIVVVLMVLAAALSWSHRMPAIGRGGRRS